MSSLDRCPLFIVSSVENSAVLHLYQQVCNKNSLAGCIGHNLKKNMLVKAVVQIRFNSKADHRKCLINNLLVFPVKSLCAALLIYHFTPVRVGRFGQHICAQVCTTILNNYIHVV